MASKNGVSDTEDADFISLFTALGAAGTARKLGINVRAVYARRSNLEKRLGHAIIGPSTPAHSKRVEQHPERVKLDISDGVALIGSDAHYWPGSVSTAHRGLVKFAEDLKPKAVIQNGDVLDLAGISRHQPIGWESRPDLCDEVENGQERLSEIEHAAPKARLIWTFGNHDARFETYLASHAPQYAKIHGVHLRDHFPRWEPCWSAWINDDVIVKHRFKGGMHAAHNNTIWAGKSIVTGHDHAGKVTPFQDYNGNRFGASCPALADIFSKAFTDYTEDNPRNWRSGFLVLTFWKGRLLWPEIAHVIEDGLIEFRGEVIKV